MLLKGLKKVLMAGLKKKLRQVKDNEVYGPLMIKK